MTYSAAAPNEWGRVHVMVFIEMLSDASLLNLLIEMLMIEVLRGKWPSILAAGIC